MIQEIHLENVGPAPVFDLELAERLNLFTGDNGLGKTFLLDVAWWALTSTWAGYPAFPHRGQGEKAEIIYRLRLPGGQAAAPVAGQFEYARQAWLLSQEQPQQKGLVVYARTDGGFSVWDPARNNLSRSIPGPGFAAAGPAMPPAYHFSDQELWDGLAMPKESRVLCNGLIRDWVSWQNQPNQGKNSPFKVLTRVISKLSPNQNEWMRPGKPTRVSLADVRDIPTVELPHGVIPVTLLAAGMKRILALAYLLVWSWYEHQQAARLINQPPTDRLVLIMDEVEAHLHPKWQRFILPALLDIASTLDRKLNPQLLVTTHAPLVLASVEPVFNAARDQLFLFELKGNEVSLRSVPWVKQGDTVGWLTSEVFGLQQARSRESEAAIEAAEAYMCGEPPES